MVMQYTNGYFFVLYYGETLVIVPPLIAITALLFIIFLSLYGQAVRLRETHADTEIALAVNLQTHKNEFSCVCKRI